MRSPLGLTRDQVLADAAANEAASVEGCHRLVDWYLDAVMAPAVGA